MPRDKDNPNNGKVMYSTENENAITAWMEANLVLFFCANENFLSSRDVLVDLDTDLQVGG